MADHARTTLRFGATSILIGLLVAVVAFVLVATMREDRHASLEGLSEAELVRLLDDVDNRIEELTTERDTLRTELTDLQTGADAASAASEVAAQQEQARKILAGVVPVTGPGVSLVIYDMENKLAAHSLVTVVQELRNSASEAIEINGVRVVTRTAIVQDGDGITVGGEPISAPYRIQAIGDADMMRVALEMPGGILASIRSRGPSTTLDQSHEIRIESIAELPTYEYAQPIN